MQQRTIERDVQFSGMGLHSGQGSTIGFKSAGVGEGITFVRTDLPGNPKVQAQLRNFSSLERGTNLESQGFKILSVEHVLGALYGLGIDNVLIELWGVEPPAGDGSALPYTKVLKEAKVVEQGSPKKFIKIDQPLWVAYPEKQIMALPLDHFKATFVLDFPGTIVGCQMAVFEEGINEFDKDVAPARTFGFLSEVESLWSKNLALGGSLENAIIIKEDGYATTLRFENELARHKILDLMGDLALMGQPLKAHVVALKAGHELNLQLAKQILKEV